MRCCGGCCCRCREAPGARRYCTARLTLLGLAALALQIALGGWTSSNYAAVACPDFPTCQNAWWPHSDYRNAFVLWRGLGTDYEGGVLDNAARIAIHPADMRFLMLRREIGSLLAWARGDVVDRGADLL